MCNYATKNGIIGSKITTKITHPPVVLLRVVVHEQSEEHGQPQEKGKFSAKANLVVNFGGRQTNVGLHGVVESDKFVVKEATSVLSEEGL